MPKSDSEIASRIRQLLAQQERLRFDLENLAAEIEGLDEQGDAQNNVEEIEPHRLAKRPAISAQLRASLFDRDEGRCQVCLVFVPDKYEIGHKIDWAAGGSSEPDNLAIMCYICNRIKPAHKTLEEYETWAAGGGRLQLIRDAIADYKYVRPGAWEKLWPEMDEEKKTALADALCRSLVK
jgi:hypothetical protein